MYKAFWFLEILSYCAVDGFAIISGYMAVDRPRKYEKLVDMWFQAFFYSFVITMLFTLAGCNPVWEKADMIRCAFPVTFGKFWYFTAFFALFFAIPILNKFMFTVEEQSAKIAFLILIILFSCMGLFADAFKTQGGYSTLWLIILYCIGALASNASLQTLKVPNYDLARMKQIGGQLRRNQERYYREITEATTRFQKERGRLLDELEELT